MFQNGWHHFLVVIKHQEITGSTHKCILNISFLQKFFLALSGHLSPSSLSIWHHKNPNSSLVLTLCFMEVREGKDFEGSLLLNFSPSSSQQKSWTVPCAISHQWFYVCHHTVTDVSLKVIFSSSFFFDQTHAAHLLEHLAVVRHLSCLPP